MALLSINLRTTIFLITLVLFIIAGFLLGRAHAERDIQPEPPPPMEGERDELPRSGEFGFDYDLRDTYTRNGILADLSFKPGITVSPDPIGFIQIVRTMDLDDYSQFYYPSIKKKQRATEDGWYVDRGEGYECRFFGMKNDGTFESYVTPWWPGSVRATLGDLPYRPENHPYLGVRWQAVTLPVGIDRSTGEVETLGYYAWSWSVSRRGFVEAVEYKIARESLMDVVDTALDAWNQQHIVVSASTRCIPQPPQITER